MHNSKQIQPVLVMLVLVAAVYSLTAAPAASQNSTVRRVNVPYTTFAVPNVPVPERAIFWFGEAGPTDSNYIDVRTIYNDDMLLLTLHIFDRILYYDATPAASDLTDWDAATLYLDLDGNLGDVPDANAHQFVAQFNNHESRDDYEAAYRGNGSGWTSAGTSFTTVDGYQGTGVNDNQVDRGWNITFQIPFASLGLANPPASGTVWGLALAVHDRDTSSGTPAISAQSWPETFDRNRPSAWGQVHFGLPVYAPPFSTPGGTVTIRHGLNGAVTPDAQVGGNANCGWPPLSGPGEFWPEWGSLNYTMYPPPNYDFTLYMNVQNQWNLGDWPCFSKYYINFPLDSLPQNAVIRSATLQLTHFGNSDPTLAQPSLIQILSVADPWQENNITWNNAPLALENVGRGWVDPLGPPWNQVTRQFDVSLAVADAYDGGQPLRLALYSADNDFHSGKYFRSARVDTPEVRPTLLVEWGTATPPTDWVYLPVAIAP